MRRQDAPISRTVHLFMTALAAVLVLIATTLGWAQVAKPNIILIVSDDFGYGTRGPTAAARDAACPRLRLTVWPMRA